MLCDLLRYSNEEKNKGSLQIQNLSSGAKISKQAIKSPKMPCIAIKYHLGELSSTNKNPSPTIYNNFTNFNICAFASSSCSFFIECACHCYDVKTASILCKLQLFKTIHILVGKSLKFNLSHICLLLKT
mgnify:FL=1